MNKIYESLKIEVQGGQYAKATMIAKIDYAYFTVGKITQEEHAELTELVETCADPNYKPVKTIEEKFAELEVEIMDLKLVAAELSSYVFDIDDRLYIVEDKIELNHPTEGGVQ